jgi:hypothetical protein
MLNKPTYNAESNFLRLKNTKEKIVHSSFKDGVNCTIKMFLEKDNEHRKVKFSHLIVYKY